MIFIDLRIKTNLQFPDIHFSGKKLEVPVTQLAFQSAIRITVSEGGTETVYDDWELDKVDRKTKGDVNTFYAVFREQRNWKTEVF